MREPWRESPRRAGHGTSSRSLNPSRPIRPFSPLAAAEGPSPRLRENQSAGRPRHSLPNELSNPSCRRHVISINTGGPSRSPPGIGGRHRYINPRPRRSDSTRLVSELRRIGIHAMGPDRTLVCFGTRFEHLGDMTPFT